MTDSDLAGAIEHTLLRAAATPADVDRLCMEAIECAFYGVCVNPIYVARARSILGASGVRVVSVVAFPLGASVAQVAAHEAEQAALDGANEIDLVIPVGLAVAGDYARVQAQVAVVRRAIPDSILKVILETGLFDPTELAELAQRVLETEPDFLKTSTGFGPRGASVADVELLVALAAGRARVKASGGIRSASDARALLHAGAVRLGTSSGVAIVGRASAGGSGRSG